MGSQNGTTQHNLGIAQMNTFEDNMMTPATAAMPVAGGVVRPEGREDTP